MEEIVHQWMTTFSSSINSSSHMAFIGTTICCLQTTGVTICGWTRPGCRARKLLHGWALFVENEVVSGLQLRTSEGQHSCQGIPKFKFLVKPLMNVVGCHGSNHGHHAPRLVTARTALNEMKEMQSLVTWTICELGSQATVVLGCFGSWSGLF